jgi:hypothetical protein
VIAYVSPLLYFSQELTHAQKMEQQANALREKQKIADAKKQ